MAIWGFDPNVLQKHVRLSKEGNYIEVDMLEVDVFNHKGKVDLPKILQYFTLVRKTCYNVTGFSFREARTGFDTYFVIQYKIEFKPNLYSKAQSSYIWMKVKFSMELIGVGNSTMLFLQTMRSFDDDDLLSTAYVKMAKVDFFTRKSTSFSESFLQRYNQFVTRGNSQLATYKPQRRPENFFSCRFVIRPSETDNNRHTGNHVYATLCLDCANTALNRGGHLTGFSGDINQPQHIAMFFAKECGEGDVVDSYVWEDDNSTNRLHFQVKKDDLLLYEADIEFCPSESIQQSKL